MTVPTATDVEREVARVAELLRARGLRRTRDRLAVVAVLAGQAQPGHLTAPEVGARLRSEEREVDRATVYRTLGLLTEIGLVHTTATAQGGTAYGLADHPHHHVVCVRCGSLEEIPAQPLTEVLRDVARTSAYELAVTGSTLQGVCPSCRARG